MAEKTFHSITLPGQDTARVPLTAAEFSTSVAYQVKDYCTYQGKLYRCTTAHAAGAWNAAHFTATDVDAEFDRKLDIPVSQASAPAKPRVGDLWIDNDENSPIYNVDASPTLNSTNAVQSGGTKVALNSLDSRKMEHGVITGDFSASVDYRVGDLVFYATTANGITTRTLYRCTTDHNAAAWNAAHFTATTLEVELQRVRDNEADTDMIGDLFGTKTTYAVGDYCIYNDNLYRCIRAIDNSSTSTPAFNLNDWTQVALANDVSDLKSALTAIENNQTLCKRNDFSGQAKSYDVSMDTIGLDNGEFHITTGYGTQIVTYCVSCKAGDVFVLTGTSSNASARLWAFTGAKGTTSAPILTRADQNTTLNSQEIVAPTGAEWLLVNSYSMENTELLKNDAYIRESNIDDFIEESIDNTLTVSGKSADAKAVGDKFAEVDNAVDELEDKVEYIVVDKGFEQTDQTNPGFTSYAGYTINSLGNITTEYGSSFTAFQMTADRDFDLYFSSANYTPTGGACHLGANGSRYRNTDNNLPTEQNPIHIVKGSIVNIAVYTYGSSFVFWWNNVGYEVNPTLISDINKGINKPVICKATNPDNVDIYIPSKRPGSNYYFDIKLCHTINADANCNVWRLDAGYLVQRDGNSFTNRVNILSGGEWTCALKIHGASDFMGGSYHGDEIINNAVILIDGTPHSFIAGETLECQSIAILENTNLYNPEEQSELAAVVARKINITADGIETDQRVEWKHAYTMDWSYLGMFCIMRTITDRGYSDTEYIPYDIGVQGFDNPMYVNNANCLKNRKLIGEYGTESKLHFELECTHIKPELPTRPTFIYNDSPYNKIYMSFCPNNYEVAVGDVWEATHVYRISENIT